MNLFQISAGMQGWLRLEVHKPDEPNRIDTGWFRNRILNQGLNRMGTGAFYSWCQVGSGSTAPTDIDSALESYVASTSNTQSTTTAAAVVSPYYAYVRKTFRFSAGAAAGNLAEVGVGWTIGPGNLFSRALILDENGDPTVITVLSDEVLDVTYELRSYAPLVDTAPADFLVSAATHSYVSRASRVTNADYWSPIDTEVSWRAVFGTPIQTAFNDTMGAITASPNGLSDGRTGITVLPYANNSLQRDFDVVWELNDGNLAGGIKSFQFGSTIGTFQLEVNPVIAKTSDKVLHMMFRIMWDRYTG